MNATAQKPRYSGDAPTEAFCHRLRDAIAEGGKPTSAEEAAKRAHAFLRHQRGRARLA